MAHVSELQAVWVVRSEMSTHNTLLGFGMEASCSCLLILTVQFLTTVKLCEQHDVSPKRLLSFNEIHGVISQKIERSSIDRITGLSLRDVYRRVRL
jgi:hypothetical protein